jgi:tetratricopeptide (TPR) repeat protein
MNYRAAAFIGMTSLFWQSCGICQGPPAPTPHHEANFDSERKQADELFVAQKPLEALPLYEDLCRQDPTIAVFAERHGAGLLTKEMTITDPNARLQVHLAAIKEIRRAQSLGDNTPYVRAILNADTKTFVGAVLAGIPLTVGYTYHGSAEAQTAFREAEAAFAHADQKTAVALYVKAATADPKWYDAALYAGDSYFRLKDVSNAGLWFAKAIAIDPDRETAYRYWGDALFQTGDRDGARAKFVEAVVAEPYGQAAFGGLGQWASRTGHQLVKPAIVRPEFTTPNGVLSVDPALESSSKDGRSSWIVYQRYRVEHGARSLNELILAGGSDMNAVVTPSGYVHTIAEEHAALRAMLADVEEKLKSGTVVEADLDMSIRNLRSLEKGNALGAWVALNAADAGIRSDYSEYRAHHRQHLVDYINAYLIR